MRHLCLDFRYPRLVISRHTVLDFVCASLLLQEPLCLSRVDAPRVFEQLLCRLPVLAALLRPRPRPSASEPPASAADRGRASRPELRLGVCGEHGGDPASIGFFDAIGLDYVSCSPFRIPIARVAAAQAAADAKSER